VVEGSGRRGRTRKEDVSKNDGKKTKQVSSPRLSDAGRQARFLQQTGLNLQGSAKARRAKGRAARSGKGGQR
jgi:hypothetical protein